MDQPIYVFGAGGLASDFVVMIDEASDIAGQDGDRYVIQAFIETAPRSATFMGKPVISEERFREVTGGNTQTLLFVLIGSPMLRERIVESLADLPITYPSFAHPSVRVHRTVSLADGVIVAQGVVIMGNVEMKRHAYINIGVTVGHDVTIGEFAFIGPGANLNGDVTIGRGSDVGAAASFRPGVVIGDRSVIGMGSVVVRDVEAGITVVGNPARPMVKR